jgi:hypothetical protein
MIRLNQSSDKPAETTTSAAATIANSAEISVSFFSTVSLELGVSDLFQGRMVRLTSGKLDV